MSARYKEENMANQEQYRAVLEDLIKQRNELQFKIGEIEAAVVALKRLMPADNVAALRPLAVQSPLPAMPGKYTGLGVRWAILNLLSEDAHAPMGTGEIAEALKVGGITSDSKNFSANVSAVLSDMNRTRNEVVSADGKWSISEKGKSTWIHIKGSVQARNYERSNGPEQPFVQ